MLTLRGEHFARKLLEHEHAVVFADPPACAKCGGSQVDLRRTAARGWYWRGYAVRPGDWWQRVDLGRRGTARP